MPESKMYALGEVKSVEDDENPNGGFDVVLSSPSLDRDGEIIDAKVFDPLPEHITFDIDHGMSTATTVGSGKPFYEGDVLRVKGTFSSIPRAQEVRTLVREGHIKTTSVAFMGAEREEKDGVTHITKAELLNGAFVRREGRRTPALRQLRRAYRCTTRPCGPRRIGWQVTGKQRGRRRPTSGTARAGRNRRLAHPPTAPDTTSGAGTCPKGAKHHGTINP
jgi:hypothetical protein